MDYKIYNNTDKKRFEVHSNGFIAFAEYKLAGSIISYTHTEVPKELSGKGIGSFMAKAVLDYALDNHLNVKPYCPFIKAYIDKHPQYQENSIFHNKNLK
ncbi:N-acetyltransferase [Cellulophaga sp. F20128]|uniref:GNAT family N-acetyltransferase n=1 Tax=Cellulophaga sp. F20128 TaxID=2926413 RepID=UPI001FF32240|nr:GNAT family N-acetyltransferase [Cellulophaga sp. F20128]MCK0156748.1 N-acetyltransferase [Cellulophaga sp. F20128]